MLQTHPTVTLIAEAPTSPPAFERCDVNTLAWLLIGDARSLLQDDVEQASTVRALQATLAELVPALREIHSNQFESGFVSDMLHTSPASVDCLLDEFATLIDTLDELSIRLEWNLPVAEIAPFADLRLARWVGDVLVFSGGTSQSHS
ncbi:MAG: hypothetical protein ACYTGL_06180 [Planctomycetota bacterium]|jgi:hypothetical protein